MGPPKRRTPRAAAAAAAAPEENSYDRLHQSHPFSVTKRRIVKRLGAIHTGQVSGQRSQSFRRVARVVGEFDRDGLGGALRDRSVQLLDGPLCLSARVKPDETHSFRQSSYNETNGRTWPYGLTCYVTNWAVSAFHWALMGSTPDSSRKKVVNPSHQTRKRKRKKSSCFWHAFNKDFYDDFVS